MTLNGTQINDLLEQQFDNTSFGNKGVPLQVSDGFKYNWIKSLVGKKVNVSNITINGTPIDPTSSYRVTVDNFMAEGGNNLSVLKAGVDRNESSLDAVDVTANYFNHSSPVSPVAPGYGDRILMVE